MINIKTKTLHRNIGLASILSIGLLANEFAFSAVTDAEATKLSKELTPLGAERAGNTSGTIPEWTGKVMDAKLTSEGRRLDLFANEKPLFTINPGNYTQYQDQLTEGQIALLKKYPDTFHMDIYPTHRTHAAPQWVYDNTLKNATRSKLDATGNSVENAYGGAPFPIPKSGNEAIWNHNLRWLGEGDEMNMISITVQPNGDTVLGGGEVSRTHYYYDKEGSLANFNGNLFELLVIYNEPTRRKGEVILVHEPVDQARNPRQAWQYIPGQRRVRRAPTVGFDNPSPEGNGHVVYDDTWLFNGSPERFDWKLVGKKEMFIPYNSNKLISKITEGDAGIKEVATPRHANPDYTRWELHRVWVLEATLKDGARHLYSKRRFYMDEDSWAIAAAENYDARGNLWRVGFANMLYAYDLPGTLSQSTWHSDLQNNVMLMNQVEGSPIKMTTGLDHSNYTPSNVRNISLR